MVHHEERERSDADEVDREATTPATGAPPLATASHDGDSGGGLGDSGWGYSARDWGTGMDLAF